MFRDCKKQGVPVDIRVLGGFDNLSLTEIMDNEIYTFNDYRDCRWLKFFSEQVTDMMAD